MRKKTTAAVLAFFFGGVGVHKFYLGQTWQGVMYLLVAWTLVPVVIGIVESVLLLTMPDNVFHSKHNSSLKKKYCAVCDTKLTFMTRPNFGGGYLNDGERVCRACFKQIATIDVSLGMKSGGKYDTGGVKKLLGRNSQNDVISLDI